VIYNLQLLDPVENLRKSNKFDPDTYVHELPADYVPYKRRKVTQ
jgi:hypothetical protein